MKTKVTYVSMHLYELNIKMRVLLHDCTSVLFLYVWFQEMYGNSAFGATEKAVAIDHYFVVPASLERTVVIHKGSDALGLFLCSLCNI